MLRSICPLRSYSICCWISTNLSYRFECLTRKNYKN
ncbi:UNVERIFIED_CONTAM: hypothetical protein GTU68_013372 [Idotea baltica]|nr:hypothetical protein [Idotea baltica]